MRTTQGKEVERAVEWLERISEDSQRRYERASAAGADLAAEVYRYTQDPEGVGTDALEAANTRFYGQHAGNFGSDPTERLETA